MIEFICDKTKLVSMERVSQILERCFQRNQFANGGPCVMALEQELRRLLAISDKKAVIATCSGTAALHGLIGGLCRHHGKLNFVTQAFTFPCHQQQILNGTLVVDIDDGGTLDLEQVPGDIDGIVVTHCFGHLGNLGRYEEWRNKTGKFLIFDNAATPATFWRGTNSLNYGHGAVVSFHHTKPLGFGEGGLVVVDREYEVAVRRCCGYKAGGGIPASRYGSNFKMSDLAASYILALLENFEHIRQCHQTHFAYARDKINSMHGVRLFPGAGDNPFPSCLALLFDQPVQPGCFIEKGIRAHKYYSPLEPLPVARDYYQRILCLPLHRDLKVHHLDYYLEVISSFSPA